MIKNIVIAVLAALLLTVGVYEINQKPVQQAQKVGAISSPDIPSPYLSWGGVRSWAGHTDILTNASTSCSFQSPNATSSLDYASITIASTTSNAIIIEMGVANDPNSTTTLIGTKYSLAASTMLTIVASTSNAAGAGILFAPNQYFNIKLGGVANGVGGNCNVQWIQD